jgi:hypothetical protein
MACRKQGPRLITQNAQARVFARCHGRELAYYGQLIGRKGEVRLDDPSPCCNAVRLVSLAGPYVGYVDEQVVKDVDRFAVQVRDLRTGRLVHLWSENSLTPTQRFYGPTALVTTNTGGVAWIAQFDSDSDPTTRYEVRRSDGAGDAAILDSGADIDPRSLARSTSTLYWTHQTPRSAPIDGAQEALPSVRRADNGRSYSSCRHPYSSTLAATRVARIYRYRENIYSCLFRGSRTRALENRHEITFVRTAGHFAALTSGSCSSGGGCQADLLFFDLTQRARFPDPRRFVLGANYISDLVLTEAGDAAVIAETEPSFAAPPGTPWRQELWLIRNRRRTLLDSSQAIERGSLARAPGTLYWTKDGTPESVQLG